jgi:hypothetical protein
MTAADLIEKLKEVPPDYPVVIEDLDGEIWKIRRVVVRDGALVIEGG